MMSRRVRALAVTLGAFALALAGCGSGAAGTLSGDADGDNVLTIALNAEPDLLDPAFVQSRVTYQVLLSVCEGLYTVDEQMSPVPQLASAMPTYSDDGLTVTIPLRTGVVFNDGTTFDAQAAKQALERNVGVEGSLVTGDFPNVESIEAVDEQTLVLHLDEPDARLINSLAGYAGMLPSPTQAEELGTDFGTDPVCVAPYELDNWAGGSSIDLVKSDLYYDADEISLDGISYVFIEDSNTRLVNLESGDIDMALSMASTDVETIEAEEGLTASTQPGLGGEFLAINVRNSDGTDAEPGEVDSPLAQSAELREAFELAIDRDQIVDVVSGGADTASCSYISPGSVYYTEPDCPETDLERARELVEASGLETPITVEVSAPSTSTTIEQALQLVQAQVAQVGFDLEISMTDLATWEEVWYTGDFEIWAQQARGLADPDAGNFRYVKDTIENGTMMYTDTSIDLIEQATAATDVEERTALLAELSEEVASWHSDIVLEYPVEAMGAAAGVEGYVWTIGGEVLPNTAGFAR